MAIEHKDLTGTQLHEPKGASTAALNTAYISDGLGSGAWASPTGSVYNKNIYSLLTTLTDLGTAGSVYFYVPIKSRILSYHVTIYGAVDVNTLFDPYVNGVLIADPITVIASGSSAGQTTSRIMVSNTDMAAASSVRVTSNGAATAVVRADIQVVFEAIP